MAGELLGFIGIGRMGGPMTLRLLDAGYALCVYDRDPKATADLAARGVKVANSPAEVASAAEIVLMSLPTPDIVKAVALGENGVARGNAVRTLIDLSTTGPGVATLVAHGLSERNITLVDAPVSGGIAGAKAGTLAVMVSCPKDGYGKVEPILKTFGKLFYTGDKPGLAQTAKLVNNLLAAAALVISSEGMAMGVKAGLDPKILLDILNVSSGRNSATQDKFPRAVLPRHFRFRVCHRAFLQGRAALPRRGGSDGRADDHGRGGAPDPGLDPGQVWAGFRFHLDRQTVGGMGRRPDQRIDCMMKSAPCYPPLEGPSRGG